MPLGLNTMVKPTMMDLDMEKAESFTMMALPMKGNGRMESGMASESNYSRTAQFTEETGKQTFKMAREKLSSLMESKSKPLGSMGRRMAKDS